MQFKYDFYLAGPFFNPEQVARMDQVKSLLERYKFSIGDPREMGPVIVNAKAEARTPEFFNKIFEGNIEGMRDSFAILACLDYKDIGTAFELGHFYHSGKLVLSFAFDNSKTNVMLSQAVDGHFSNISALEKFLDSFKDRIQYRSSSIRDLLKTEKAETNE
jgi:nucleoside 2-deoxyribosyltransferase